MITARFVNALAGLSPQLPPFSISALTPIATDTAKKRLLAITQLRHARYCSLASVMGEIAVRQLLPWARGNRRAILTAGGDLHMEVASTFAQRLQEAGANRLNPIMFPHTLPSATATTLAAQFNAHVCAVAVEGSGAFGHAWHLAEMLISSKCADEVLIFTCRSGESARGGHSGHMTGIGMLLEASSAEADSLTIPLGAARGFHAGEPAAEAVRFLLTYVAPVSST